MIAVATAITSRLEARFAEELAAVDGTRLVLRCADVDELLAAVEAGRVSVAALSPDFPGVTGNVMAELALRGATPLGVVGATSVLDERQCEAWGLRQVHVVGSGSLAETFEALTAGAQAAPSEVPAAAARPNSEAGAPRLGEEERDDGACVVVVWGPAGSPGRTTTALHLARELAADGACLVVDADTVAPSVAGHLGLLDEAPGLLAAARLVDAGTLNVHQLRSICAHVDDGFDVLSGIGNARRWQELTRFHLGRILDLARASYRWIILDVAADLGSDEDLLFDTVAPSRNGAALEAIAQADIALALAGSDPIALQRFAQSVADLTAMHSDVRVVVTKARDAAVGGSAATVVNRTLERFVGLSPVAVIPDARDELDAALLRGRFVDGGHREGIAFLEAHRALASVLGASVPQPTQRSRRWRVRR